MGPRPPGSGGKGSRLDGPTTPLGNHWLETQGPPRCLHKPVSKTRRGLRWGQPSWLVCVQAQSPALLHRPRGPQAPDTGHLDAGPVTTPGSTQPHCRASAPLPTWTDPHRTVTESDACGGPATLSLDSRCGQGSTCFTTWACTRVCTHTSVCTCVSAHAHVCPGLPSSTQSGSNPGFLSAVLSWPAQVSRWRTTTCFQAPRVGTLRW